MAVGGLIGAYQEDDSGGCARSCLAGADLLEYQVRCAAAPARRRSCRGRTRAQALQMRPTASLDGVAWSP